MLNFLGGLFQGLTQGMARNQKIKEEEEELKLRKRMFESSDKLRLMQERKLEQQIQQEEAEKQQEEKLRESILSRVRPETADVQNPQWAGRAAGDEPPGTFNLREGLVSQRQQNVEQAGLRAGLVGLVPKARLPEVAGLEMPLDPMLQAYLGQQAGASRGLPGQPQAQMPQQWEPEPVAGPLAQAPTPQPGTPPNVGMTIRRPGGSIRINPPREAVGAQGRMFADYEREEKAKGKTPEQIREGWNEILRAQGVARAQAPFDVRTRPENIETEQEFARRRGLGAATGRRQVEAQGHLKDIASTEQIIGDLEALSKRINTATGGVGRFTQGAGKVVGSWLQTDADAADLNKLRESYAILLSRSILSERGVLTNQDRQYATNTFPSLWDTKEVANRSIFRLKTLVNLQRQAEESLAAGKPLDVNEFRKKWRAMTGASPTQEPTASQPLPAQGQAEMPQFPAGWGPP